LKKQRLIFWTVLALILLAITFCKSSSGPAASDTPKDNPSFAGDIQPIFSASCAVSGCHNSTAQAGLNVSSGQAYGNLVNVDSTEDATKKRVLPNDANNSYLVMKVEGRQTSGVRMPSGGSPLSSAQIQNIKNWINKGANNN